MFRALFSPGETPFDNRAVLGWWELRRVPYNVIVGSVGIASIVALEALGSVLLARGEDAVEPLALVLGVIVYGTACNIAYTLGWVSEIYFFSHAREAGLMFRKKAFIAGLALSCLIPIGLVLLCILTWMLHLGTA